MIAAIVVGFSLWQRPSEEQRAQQQHYNDSIALVQQQEAKAKHAQDSISAVTQQAAQTQDTATLAQSVEALQKAKYGVFSTAATPALPQDVVLENEVLRLHISTKGGRIEQAELIQYKAYGDSVNPLSLFRGDESEMRLLFRSSDNSRMFLTDEMHFALQERNDSMVAMRAQNLLRLAG